MFFFILSEETPALHKNSFCWKVFKVGRKQTTSKLYPKRITYCSQIKYYEFVRQPGLLSFLKFQKMLFHPSLEIFRNSDQRPMRTCCNFWFNNDKSGKFCILHRSCIHKSVRSSITNLLHIMIFIISNINLI